MSDAGIWQCDKCGNWSNSLEVPSGAETLQATIQQQADRIKDLEHQLDRSEKRYMTALALVPAASDGYSDTLQDNPAADYIKDLEQKLADANILIDFANGKLLEIRGAVSPTVMNHEQILEMAKALPKRQGEG